ncbi:MAG: hypothetical protein C0172_02625 [Caldisphaera sp.]|nr:MAG: hypothetical protein C0172_02625 [Caldisphaera sp.]
MEIIYKINDQEAFKFYWEKYIEENAASFRYLPDYLDYTLSYINNLEVDLSFVVLEGKKCVGICFLPVERDSSYFSVSNRGGM